MVCVRCSTDNPESATFCNSCGWRIRADTSKNKKAPRFLVCTKCSTKHSEGAKCCNSCGWKLQGDGSPLGFLAPRIVEAIAEGRQPVDLTLEALTRRIDLPLRWSAQHQALGVSRK
jgi:ribosomal protein L40E